MPCDCRESRKVTLLAVISSISVTPPQQGVAQKAYCPDPAHATPEKVPEPLIEAVAKTFAIDPATVRNTAFVRCVGRKLKGCYTGANLVCFKANTSRELPGATTWCRDHPASKGIPMAATGHDTIYDWSCSDHRAVAGRTVLTVDPQGYIAENWKEIR